MLEEPQEEKPKKRVLLVFGVALLFGSLAATFSANITLNDNNRVEFGQGIKLIKACDSFIGVTPRGGAATLNGLSAVQFVDLSSLDVEKCLGRLLSINLYEIGASSPLSLYEAFGLTYSTLSVLVDSQKRVCLIENDFRVSAGQSMPGVATVSSGSIGGRSDGTFSFEFAVPRALVASSSVKTLTTASSGNSCVLPSI